MTANIETLSKICKNHLSRQLFLEEGCTTCDMFVSGNVIKLIEQWKTEEDYGIHEDSEHLKLFKILIEPLIESIHIEKFSTVHNFKE